MWIVYSIMISRLNDINKFLISWINYICKDCFLKTYVKILRWRNEMGLDAGIVNDSNAFQWRDKIPQPGTLNHHHAPWWWSRLICIKCNSIIRTQLWSCTSIPRSLCNTLRSRDGTGIRVGTCPTSLSDWRFVFYQFKHDKKIKDS